MGRIYTRTGDKGTTAIHGGLRVPKTDIRIEANGTIDELNVAVGNIRILLEDQHPWQSLLKTIQINLMSAMSLIATPSENRESNPNRLPDNLVEDIEKEIDEINRSCISPSSGFILPGGNPRAVALHQARVVCRRAERRLWELNSQDYLPDFILQFFNRLSDLFFVMARFEVISSGNEEEIWRKFGYKKSLKS